MTWYILVAKGMYLYIVVHMSMIPYCTNTYQYEPVCTIRSRFQMQVGTVHADFDRQMVTARAFRPAL
jgi:hypothetical protein